jgi:hypothetical protein
MFERFTDRARRVVVLAQEEARMLDHNYIGTEHLLLGLVHEEDGVAARALKDLEVSLDTVRERVETMIGRGKNTPTGHIPFTPRAKKVLELSLRESVQLGHDHIGTEHILLGLMREGDGVACRVLTELGLSAEAVRQSVIGRIGGRSESFGSPVTVEVRLKRIERRLGISAGGTLTALDEQIAQVRRDKQAAIDAQDFDRAAELRQEESQLLSQRVAAEETVEADVTPILSELADARAEIARLTALLREHGIDPDPPKEQANGA